MTSQAFEDGYQTYVNGGEVDDNPFKMTQDEYQDWENGYYHAMNKDYSQQEY